MEEQGKTHWRRLQVSDYFGAFSLEQGQTEMVVKILKIEKKLVKTAESEEFHTVATLEGQKPWILNVTNRKAITKALGSPNIEDWIGKCVTVYATTIRAFGENVEAIRVRTTAPKGATKEALTPATPKWATAVAALKATPPTITIDVIKTHYSLSAENETKLLHEASTI